MKARIAQLIFLVVVVHSSICLIALLQTAEHVAEGSHYRSIRSGMNIEVNFTEILEVDFQNQIGEHTLTIWKLTVRVTKH